MNLSEVLADLASFKGSDCPPIAPSLIFKISKDNAIFCNAIRQWEKGLLDWEETLRTIIDRTEKHIKEMAKDSDIQEIIKREAFLPIPVLEISLMPKFEKDESPLLRQQSLIKVCYILNEIQKAYLGVMIESVHPKRLEIRYPKGM